MSEVQTNGHGLCSSSDDVKAKIEELRKRILVHDNLKLMRTDDAYLLRFLHKADFNVDDALHAMENYYRYVVQDSDWLALEITDKMVECLNMHVKTILPTSDRHGKRISYMKMGTIDPSKMTMAEMYQLEFILLESILDDPDVQEHGLCMVLDIAGYSWRLLRWLTPSNMWKAIRRLENIIVKDVTFHIVRCSKFAKIAINMLWPFMPEDIKGKFKFHFDNLKPLLDDISPENLPKEYGGTFEVNFEKLNEDLLRRRTEIHKKLEHYASIST